MKIKDMQASWGNMTPQYRPKGPALSLSERQAATRANDVNYQAALSSGKYDEAMPIDPVTGRPLTPKWNSLLGEDGLLQDKYLAKDQGNTQALDKYRGEALRDPSQQSTWAKLMNEQIDTQQLSKMDAGNQMIASQKAGLMSDLAQTGGLGAGARERAFRNAGRDGLMSKQRSLREGMTDRNNVSLKDEENRQTMLGQSVNMDQARAGYLTGIQQQNNTNTLNENNAGREQKQNMWTKEMESWAANKQADAQRSAACFSEEMLVAMKDGSRKKISDIKVGEETLLGGPILQVIVTLKDWPGDVYDYQGVIVTGTHAVLENDVFVRVKDSKKAKLHDETVSVVYNLTTQNHIMILGNTVFSDYQEVPFDEAITNLSLSLRKLNENFRPALA